MNKSLKFMGIDAGLDACGVAVTELGENVLHTETIRTKPAEGTVLERAHIIAANVLRIWQAYDCDYVIIEDYRLYGMKSQATSAVLMGKVIGYIAGYLRGRIGRPINVHVCTSDEWRKAIIGRPNASNHDVEAVLKIRLNESHLGRTSEHARDAIGIALYAEAVRQ